MADAARWYEGERPGLGDEFLSEVAAFLSVIADDPFRFQEVNHGRRRALLRRFPYAIFFERTAEDEIAVLGIIHLHRNPDVWRDRVSEPELAFSLG